MKKKISFVVFVFMVYVLNVGCQALQRKSVQMVQHVQGIRMTSSVDPGTSSATPTLFFGELLNVISTVPDSARNVASGVRMYSWLTGELYFEQYLMVSDSDIRIDTKVTQ